MSYFIGDLQTAEFRESRVKGFVRKGRLVKAHTRTAKQKNRNNALMIGAGVVGSAAAVGGGLLLASKLKGAGKIAKQTSQKTIEAIADTAPKPVTPPPAVRPKPQSNSSLSQPATPEVIPSPVAKPVNNTPLNPGETTAEARARQKVKARNSKNTQRRAEEYRRQQKVNGAIAKKLKGSPKPKTYQDSVLDDLRNQQEKRLGDQFRTAQNAGPDNFLDELQPPTSGSNLAKSSQSRKSANPNAAANRLKELVETDGLPMPEAIKQLKRERPDLVRSNARGEEYLKGKEGLVARRMLLRSTPPPVRGKEPSFEVTNRLRREANAKIQAVPKGKARIKTVRKQRKSSGNATKRTANSLRRKDAYLSHPLSRSRRELAEFLSGANTAEFGRKKGSKDKVKRKGRGVLGAAGAVAKHPATYVLGVPVVLGTATGSLVGKTIMNSPKHREGSRMARELLKTVKKGDLGPLSMMANRFMARPGQSTGLLVGAAGVTAGLGAYGTYRMGKRLVQDARGRKETWEKRK